MRCIENKIYAAMKCHDTSLKHKSLILTFINCINCYSCLRPIWFLFNDKSKKQFVPSMWHAATNDAATNDCRCGDKTFVIYIINNNNNNHFIGNYYLRGSPQSYLYNFFGPAYSICLQQVNTTQYNCTRHQNVGVWAER